jgi:TRAP-type C4-dicarboxylate transport system substrate-binding protein
MVNHLLDGTGERKSVPRPEGGWIRGGASTARQSWNSEQGAPMRSTTYSRILAVLLATCACWVMTGNAAAEEWKMASGYPDNSYLTATLRDFLADVERRTKGEIKVTLHNNQSLVKLPDIPRAVQSNQVSLGEVYAANLGNQDPMFTLDAIPFLAPDEATAWALLSAQRPYFEKWFAKRGSRLLFAQFFPAQGFFTKKPVTSAADLAGVKLRIYSNETRRMGELLKAQPLVVQFGEVPQAFATGMIDGMFTSPQTGIDTQAWDFTTHYVNVGAMRAKLFVVVNEAAFQKLPKASQEALLAAGAAAEKADMQRGTEATREQLETLAKRGIKVSEASPAFLSELKGIGKTMVDEWRQRATPEQREVLQAYETKLKVAGTAK